MASSSKTKAGAVSSSSFLNLKAELAKKEAQYKEAKASGQSTAIVGGVKRPDKVIAFVLLLSPIY